MARLVYERVLDRGGFSSAPSCYGFSVLVREGAIGDHQNEAYVLDASFSIEQFLS